MSVVEKNNNKAMGDRRGIIWSTNKIVTTTILHRNNFFSFADSPSIFIILYKARQGANQKT